MSIFLVRRASCTLGDDAMWGADLVQQFVNCAVDMLDQCKSDVRKERTVSQQSLCTVGTAILVYRNEDALRSKEVEQLRHLLEERSQDVLVVM